MKQFKQYMEAVHQAPERMQRYDLYINFNIKLYLHKRDWGKDLENLINALNKVCKVVSYDRYTSKYVKESWEEQKIIVKIKASSSSIYQIEKAVHSTLPDYGVSFILYNINKEIAGASLFSNTKRYEKL